MRRPGRKSAASHVAVVVDVSQQRPEPPPEIPDVERSIWRELVERYRADWFRGSEHLLESYVGLLATERFLATQIAQVRAHDPLDHAKLASLVATQKLVVTSVGNLGTKLRLTPRSTFDRYAPKLASTLPKPWDLGRDPA
jgi:hypothetical protein